jgi:hypothetical protein
MLAWGMSTPRRGVDTLVRRMVFLTRCVDRLSRDMGISRAWIGFARLRVATLRRPKGAPRPKAP